MGLYFSLFIVWIKGYTGILSAVGILLIIISEILDGISKYLKLFVDGKRWQFSYRFREIFDI